MIQKSRVVFFVLATMISAVASAADAPSSASRKVMGGGEDGGQNCFYQYSIEKIAQEFVRNGEEVKFLVIVKNSGTCKLERIRLMDKLPRELEFVSASPMPSDRHDGYLKWDKLSLNRGDFATFEIVAKAHSHFNGLLTVTNQSCAFAPQIGIKICGLADTMIFKRDYDAE